MLQFGLNVKSSSGQQVDNPVLTRFILSRAFPVHVTLNGLSFWWTVSVITQNATGLRIPLKSINTWPIKASVRGNREWRTVPNAKYSQIHIPFIFLVCILTGCTLCPYIWIQSTVYAPRPSTFQFRRRLGICQQNRKVPAVMNSV
jgi:hypothetical protein